MSNNVRFEQKLVNILFANNLEITKFAVLLTIHKSLQANLRHNPAVLDEAMKVAYLIDEDSEACIEALKDLASALAYAGRYYEAKQVLKTVKDSPVVKAKELRELAVALASAGTVFAEEASSVFSDAKKVALQIKHKPTQIKALKQLMELDLI
jgi:hypothetical protein